MDQPINCFHFRFAAPVRIKRVKIEVEPPQNNGNRNTLREQNAGTSLANPTHGMHLRNRSPAAGPSGINRVAKKETVKRTRTAKKTVPVPLNVALIQANGNAPNDEHRQENNANFIDLTLDATLDNAEHPPNHTYNLIDLTLIPQLEEANSSAIVIDNDTPTEPADLNYAKLLELEESTGVIPNFEVFECTICFATVAEREGVVLRNCLHTFCRDCIGQLIVLNEPCDVKCPFIQSDQICNEVLQDREIRGLLSDEQYKEYLVKSLRTAENTAPDAFHCRKPNCTGWTFYDPNVTRFDCPVCKASNCISCKVSLIPHPYTIIRENSKWFCFDDEIKTTVNELSRLYVCKLIFQQQKICLMTQSDETKHKYTVNPLLSVSFTGRA